MLNEMPISLCSSIKSRSVNARLTTIRKNFKQLFILIQAMQAVTVSRLKEINSKSFLNQEVN